jgi:hypothetical protein
MAGDSAQAEEIAMTVNTAQTQQGPWVQPPDMTVGVNRYFELLQRQIKLTGQLTATWVSAMNTLSAMVLANGQGSLWLPALIGARTSQRRIQSASEPNPNDRSATQEPLSAEVFDEVIELFVDDDIIAAVSEQATAK